MDFWSLVRGLPSGLLAAFVMSTSVIASLRRYVWQPSTIIVLALVLGFNVLVEFDWVQKSFPLIQKGQLGFHRILCWTMPRPLTAKWVRTVEITDQSHQVGGITDRNFLATLINNARKAPAEVIVLDFKFQAPAALSEGQDYSSRKSQDTALVDAIKNAADDGIPVIVPCWLEKLSWREWKRLPDFFNDSDFRLADSNGQCPLLRSTCKPHPADAPVEPTSGPGEVPPPPPACVRIGNINGPADARHIPLVSRTLGSRTGDTDPGAISLALAAATAHEDAINLCPRTSEKPIIANAIKHREFVVGSFIPATGFQTIAAENLFDGDLAAIQNCRGRIVLIGGKWRDDSGNAEPVDTHDTPVGPMAGMYIHANYIEALLDDRYQRIVPLPFGLAFDLLVGILLYIYFHEAANLSGKLKVLGVFLLPLLASYVIFANFNWYLDFILPLMLCFAHLVFELGRSYQKLRHLDVAAHSLGGSE